MIKNLYFIVFLLLINLVNSSYYDFFPYHIANIKTNNYNLTKIKTKCFDQINFNLVEKKNKIDFNLNITQKENIFCSDTLIISNNFNYYIKNIIFEGYYNIFSTNNNQEIADINFYGINIFIMEDNPLNLIYNILITINLFIDTSISQYLNLDFLEKKMGIQTKNSILFDIPKKENIKNGTTLGILRYDGIDPLIMYGTGSRIGHTAVIYHQNCNTYVYESTDKNPFGKNYWPPPYGVIKTEFDEWIKYAKKANYMVNYFELSDKNQEIVNKNMNNFYKWFDNVKGSPYGTHNFINGWIDTYNNNYPNNFSKELLINFLSLLYKQNINTEFIEQDFGYAIKNRINMIDKKFNENNLTKILQWTINNNFSIYDLLILPEMDIYRYNKKESMVCDVFVLKSFKNLGLFDNYNIQVSEFTPKDLYELKIWKDKPKQILGKYKITLNNFNTINLYDNMNEKCPSLPKKYNRENNC